MSRMGERGGHTVSVDQAEALFTAFRGSELTRLRNTIMRLALLRGEFHCELVAGISLSTSNLVGIAVRQLIAQGYLREVDRRRGRNAASHGRKSGVYWPTPEAAERAPQEWISGATRPV